jgi:hypothetical protein
MFGPRKVWQPWQAVVNHQQFVHQGGVVQFWRVELYQIEVNNVYAGGQ